MKFSMRIQSPLARDLLIGCMLFIVYAFLFLYSGLTGWGASFFIYGGVLFGICIGLSVGAVLAEWKHYKMMGSR